MASKLKKEKVDNDSDNEDHVEKKEVVDKKPAVKKPKRIVTASKDEEPKKAASKEDDKWEADDDSSSSAESESDAETNDRRPKMQRKPRSVAMNFDFEDYRSLNKKVSEVNNVDLVRVLVVRASDEGQQLLKRCLQTVLRAMNNESEFPSLQRTERSDFPPRTSYNSYNSQQSDRSGPYYPRGRGRGRGGYH
uniref:Uncharacterized protein n=1 Tax=viral metagenome TaxID=1070528 RepID=A0A6C0EFS0_9ZZZZ